MSLDFPRHPTSASSRYVLSAVAGLVIGVVLVAWRGFYWHHAVLVGLAAAALVYSAMRAVDNLRRLHR